MNGIRLLYEDNHLLVVEKPVNMLSQGDATGDPDLLAILKEDLKRRYGKPGNVYLGLVHRLDRPVGGVMVFAKTSKAASRLSEQIRTRALKKTYLAVIRGKPAPASAQLKHFLVKDTASNTVRVALCSERDAREAVLDYRLVSTSGISDGLSLVEIDLHTGRPHQIRVQFAAIGHPLYGDMKYGGGDNKPGQQLALWSFRIACRHPVQKEEMVFESKPPDAFPWSLFVLPLEKHG